MIHITKAFAKLIYSKIDALEQSVVQEMQNVDDSHPEMNFLEDMQAQIQDLKGLLENGLDIVEG